MADQQARRAGVLSEDTIAAAATAAGQAAVGIIRLSGPEALTIAEQVCGKALQSRLAEYCRFRSPTNETIDDGIALAFPGPRSFTGEDVVELQCHGSPVIVDWLLETVYGLGARPAAAGEFSQRAFLNGRIDLTQAEAIADLIASGSRTQVTAAGRSLRGRFSERVSELQSALSKLRVLSESWLDFPDEDIDHAAGVQLQQCWRELQTIARDVLGDAAHGRQLRDDLVVALAGLPNAGKSSLLNRLADADAAIVTAVPGTTRDTIRESVDLGGVAVTLIDMAGLRETEDPIEGEGVKRAQAEIADAGHVLWIADITLGLEVALADARRSLPTGRPVTIVLNKIDLIDGLPNRFNDACPVVTLSATTGAGVAELKSYLKALAGGEAGAGTFSARRRHLDALAAMERHIDKAGPMLESELELAAEELKLAQACLDELTGEHTSDDLLGEIFSSFCIGK